MYNYNKVRLSGVNTYNLPTLSWEEMKRLFQELEKGNKEIREKLISCNLKLVLSVLKKFSNRGENMDDLFQIGCVGLMKAVDNFKLEYNVNFSTYAVPMILGEVRRYLRDNNYIHMSRSLKIAAQKIQSARELYLQKNQREPTLSELSAEVGIPPEEIILAYNANTEPLSFFEPVYNDSTDPLHIIDLLKDDENGEERMLETVALKEALAKLEPRERYILIARFFQGKTQMEVARRVGISQAQISRIEKAALKFIRRQYSEQAGVFQEKI